MSDQKILPIHYSLLIRVFEHDGFSIRRRKGDHVIMTKQGINRPLMTKTSPKSVRVTHIRITMTTAGMSRERYFEILDQLG
jgi:predicted RNA binding protein YcfA (HicA-like mRNA interferase family)